MLSEVLSSEQVRLRGIDGGDEGVSQKEAVQGVEGVDAVLPGRGDIAADAAEVHEGVKVAEGAGDLLAQLHHSQITLREIVVERDREVAHEGEDAVVVVPESVEQVAGFALLAAAPTLGAGQRFRERVLGIAGFHDPPIALVESVEVLCRQGGEARVAGGIDRRLDRQQMVDHRLGPLLALLLPQEDQFAQEVRVTESVVAVVLEVGVPEVVDGAAPEVGQDVGGVHGFAPAPLVRKVPGEPSG